MRMTILLAMSLASFGYLLWAYLVIGRYESLCQISYWEATSAQLRACEEHLAEMPAR